MLIQYNGPCFSCGKCSWFRYQYNVSLVSWSWLDMVSKTLDMLGKHTTSELNPSPPLLSFGRRFFQSSLAGSYLICLLLRSGTQLSPLASWRSAHLLSVLSLMLPLSCVLILHLVSYLMMPRLPLKAFWKLHKILDWKAFFFSAGHLSVLWVLSRSPNHSDSSILAACTVLVSYLGLVRSATDSWFRPLVTIFWLAKHVRQSLEVFLNYFIIFLCSLFGIVVI